MAGLVSNEVDGVYEVEQVGATNPVVKPGEEIVSELTKPVYVGVRLGIGSPKVKAAEIDVTVNTAFSKVKLVVLVDAR